jgi:hydroxyethylthiazole kinase-like uncharacterized protein yjeF
MDILTGARMKKVDEDTIARFCPGLELMERAGRQVADFIIQRFPADRFKAAVFVGPGNNGGDALVVARLLAEEGRACSIHYLKGPDAFTPDAYKNYQRVQERLPSHRHLREINFTRPDWTGITRKDFIDTTVIVDGLFGTGLSRPLEGRALTVVQLINRSGLPVVGIDMPSGLDADTGEVLGDAVRANYTITMGYPKLGMLFHPAKEYVGEIIVADIGFPAEVLQVHSLGIYLLDRGEVVKRLPPRPTDLHKYQAGTVLLIAGSRAYTGAVALAAEAALRSGCGMVYAAVPEGIRPVIQSHLREAIVVPLPETSAGTVAPDAGAVLAPYLAKADVIALGPGLTTEEGTAAFIRELVPGAGKPLVLDADGINAFAGRSDLLRETTAELILTPHSGELGRLLKTEIPATPVERIETTREAARSLGAVLLHKGAPSLIASGAGDVWVSYHGNSALATGGTGDVLTGLVAGLRAQGNGALDAAAIACYLHGRAGEHAAGDLGLRGVIAGDLLKYIGRTILDVEKP